MQQKIVDELKENLEEQLALYSELLEVTGRKQEALIHNHIKELDALVSREEMLILQGTRLENKRMALVKELAVQLNRPEEELKLHKLAELFPQFQGIKDKFENIISEIQAKNALNNKLLQQAKKIVDFTLGLMTTQRETTYSGDKGKAQARPGTRQAYIVDRSV